MTATKSKNIAIAVYRASRNQISRMVAKSNISLSMIDKNLISLNRYEKLGQR